MKSSLKTASSDDQNTSWTYASSGIWCKWVSIATELKVGKWSRFGKIWSWGTTWTCKLDSSNHDGCCPLVTIQIFLIHGAYISTLLIEYFSWSKSKIEIKLKLKLCRKSYLLNHLPSNLCALTSASWLFWPRSVFLNTDLKFGSLPLTQV